MRRGTMVEYKFVLSKIQSLVCDSRGRMRYMKEFDHVIDDIYGVKNLAKKINDSYDSRDIIATIEKFGLEQLIGLFNSRKNTDMMADLVAVRYRLRELQSAFQKSRKKSGRRDKRDVKEGKYLSKLYTDSIRYMKKRLGVQDVKNLYKRKYSALTSVLDNDDFGFDDGFSSLLDDDIFGNEYDDYDYDYDDRTELDDFRDRLNGGNMNRRVSRNRMDDDLEFDDEFNFGQHDTDQRINQLTDVVSELSSAVQRMMSKQQFMDAERGRKSTIVPPIQPKPMLDPNQLPPVDRNQFDFQYQLDAVQRREEMLMQQIADLGKAQQATNSFLQEIMSSDDDYGDDEDDINYFSQREAIDRYNNGSDPHQIQPGSMMSRDEVIEMINQQQPRPKPTPEADQS